jgi:hypothetical protein
VSTLQQWLEARKPAPPPDLAAAVTLEERPGDRAELLAAEGVARLHLARSRLGRERTSAFRLLEADALVTYACEAALQGDDPEGALRRILASTSA